MDGGVLQTEKPTFGNADLSWTQEFLNQFTATWWNCDLTLPDLGALYSHRDQIIHERKLDHQVNKFFSELEHLSRNGGDWKVLQERFTMQSLALAKDTFGLEDRYIQWIQRHQLMDAVFEFSYLAHEFDPTLSLENIYQAGRNVVAMNLLQLLLGLQVQITPAVFAFSLLYPYTDNYLDDPSVTSDAKYEFNIRFKHRLMGENIPPANPQEITIYSLIEMIEDQFNRVSFPQVYQSLLDIYFAQLHSISQIRRGTSPYELDVLSTTFQKGGASVLADGYLVAGNLTRHQAEFCYGLGTFTQIIDDLEDVRRDLRDGVQTLFTQTAGRWPMDNLTNRVFHYGAHIVSYMDIFEVSDLPLIQEMFNAYFLPILIESAGQAGKYYSRAYIKKLEEHFPFHFSFTYRLRKKLAKHKNTISRFLDTHEKTDLIQKFLLSPASV